VEAQICLLEESFEKAVTSFYKAEPFLCSEGNFGEWSAECFLNGILLLFSKRCEKTA